jgi:hypothetical protein
MIGLPELEREDCPVPSSEAGERLTKLENLCATMNAQLKELMKRIEAREPVTCSCAPASALSDNITLLPAETHNARTQKKTKRRQYTRFDDHNLFNNGPKFPEHLKMTFDVNDRPDVCPYKLREELGSMTGRPILNITASGDDSFTIKVDTKLQSDTILSKNRICGKPCKIIPHPTFSMSSGLIYIENLPSDEVDEFITGLVQYEECIVEAKIAPKIKPRRITTTALLLKFNCSTPPNYIDIPFFDAKTKVTPFERRPMRCYKCQKYGHTSQNCNGKKNAHTASRTTTISETIPCRAHPKNLTAFTAK